MNTGALLLQNDFFTREEIQGISNTIHSQSWKPVWEDGSYADDKWREIKVITDYKDTDFYKLFPELDKVKSFFKSDIISMMFYSMTPGAEIHPHRDMIGNVGWGGLRFHIPIQTNPNLIFKVSNKRVIMNVGELWALDTSYLHAVSNKGDTERIHLVFDIKVNEWVKTSLLPKRNYKFYWHQAYLMLLYAKKIFSVMFRPKEFRNNVKEMSKIIKNLSGKAARSK
jgi:aspartyl/asparaginyl beta-hydroxylase (cupin superfamily)